MPNSTTVDASTSPANSTQALDDSEWAVDVEFGAQYGQAYIRRGVDRGDGDRDSTSGS